VIDYGTITFLAFDLMYAYEFQLVQTCFQARCFWRQEMRFLMSEVEYCRKTFPRTGRWFFIGGW